MREEGGGGDREPVRMIVLNVGLEFQENLWVGLLVHPRRWEREGAFA